MRLLTIILAFIISQAAWGQRLSELPTLDETPASGDKFFIYDASDPSSLKGITFANLTGGIVAPGDFLGVIYPTTELTLSSGSITISASGSYSIETEGGAASDDFSNPICPAGLSGYLTAADDAHTVVFISSVIQTPGNVDISLDQDGDIAKFVCPATNTLVITDFLDENGRELNNQTLDGGAVLSGATTRPANTFRFQLSRHADNCQSLVDGLDGEACRQVDTGVRYNCVTSDGLCDTTGEWIEDNGAVAPTNFWDLIGNIVDVDGGPACSGSASFATFVTFDVLAAELAVGDVFRVVGGATNTTPTTDSDFQLSIGGNVIGLNSAVNTGTSWYSDCLVISDTSIACFTQDYDDDNADNSSNGIITVSSLAANPLTITIEFRNCAADSTLTSAFIYAVKANF